jgi:hypothetical protein
VTKDITSTLAGWAFDPNQVSVRIIHGEDGKDKIQVRLDLGLMQMEFDGRPDGQRTEGFESWFDYYRHKQEEHERANPDGVPFRLDREDCAKLLREGVQYYHRYLSFWFLERFELCARDTQRNLRLFSFVRDYAKHERDKLQFDQWRPYVTMMHARAVAMPLVRLGEYAPAITAVEAGIAGIRRFLADYGQQDHEEKSTELRELLNLREELQAKTDAASSVAVVDPILRIREKLADAVREERFEEAARLRDEIQRLSNNVFGSEPPPTP